MSRDRQKEAENSNVDSEDTEYREEILDTTLVEQRRMKHKSPKEVQVT